MNHVPSDFPRLFDTHTHLSDQKFDSDRQDVLKRCDEWLAGWINVGSDLNSTNFQKLVKLVELVKSVKLSKFWPGCPDFRKLLKLVKFGPEMY